jgi:hypothetical protein
VVFSAATLYSHPNCQPIFLGHPPPGGEQFLPSMATYEDDMDYSLDHDETSPWFPTSGSSHPVSPGHLATSEAYTLWVASEPISSSPCPLTSSLAPPNSPDPNPLQLPSREPPFATAPQGLQTSPPYFTSERLDSDSPLGSFPLSHSGPSSPTFNPFWVSPIFLPSCFPLGSSPLFPNLWRTTLGSS